MVVSPYRMLPPINAWYVGQTCFPRRLTQHGCGQKVEIRNARFAPRGAEPQRRNEGESVVESPVRCVSRVSALCFPLTSPLACAPLAFRCREGTVPRHHPTAAHTAAAQRGVRDAKLPHSGTWTQQEELARPSLPPLPIDSTRPSRDAGPSCLACRRCVEIARTHATRREADRKHISLTGGCERGQC